MKTVRGMTSKGRQKLIALRELGFEFVVVDTYELEIIAAFVYEGQAEEFQEIKEAEGYSAISSSVARLLKEE